MQGTNLGGMEQASLKLMLGLKDLGHSVKVLSLNPIGSMGPLLNKHAITSKGLLYLGKGGWRSLLLLRKEFNVDKSDALIMTGHHLISMIVMGDICIGKRILAIHFHHTGVKPNWQWRLIYKFACKRFKAITFPSDFVRREAEAIYPAIRNLSHTVRNPLSIPSYASSESRISSRRAIGISDDAMVVGNAGWLIPRKRFDIFIHVAHKISVAMPKAIFLIAGDGEERIKLLALASLLGISDRIKWLGWQRDLTPFFKSLDVMLFNSDWDAMGLSPLEAMSHGVPLVASVQQGGLKEVVCKEEYGFLIPTHDIEALANKVIYFLENPIEARCVALAGRNRVQELSNPIDHVKKIEALLLN